VKCWGDNYLGQLGDGTTTDRHAPVDVVGLTSGVASISSLGGHTCAVTSSVGIKCWGENTYGQLGDGTHTYKNTPVDMVVLTSGVASISSGGDYTCAVTTSGGVKCWGWNYSGQLGDGTTTYRYSPVDVVDLTSSIASVSSGYSHTCAVTSSGGVKCWGRNFEGQLGDGTYTYRNTPVDVVGLSSSVYSISSGSDYTCAVTTSGGVKCWGSNYSGQLGDGTIINIYTPIGVVGLTSGIASVSSGGGHTCAVTTSGGVKCWGWNIEGQLGDGSDISRHTPDTVFGLGSGIASVSSGYDHTCALTSSGGVKCWGDNNFGQLGDGTNTDINTPVDVVDLTSGVASVSSGYDHTCALTSSGGVKCWGWNYSGQLGDGTFAYRNTPVDVVGLTSGVASISSGSGHTCAVTTSGGVKCWGWNGYGQLGDGTTTNRNTPVDVVGLTSVGASVSSGSSHTCATTTSGGVKCWGKNDDGQLGDGVTTDRHTPVDVVGLTSSVTSISSGGKHTCAVTTSGSVKCWGCNVGGKLGIAPGWVPVNVIGF
jgi:alpha-tubulin suppressor-like RCC1 family protein